MKKIALNYIYLSKKHAGGKDQVGLNLLKGLQENGVAKDMVLFCYDYSVDFLKSISPDITIIPIDAPDQGSELKRMIGNMCTNTFVIPKLIKEHGVDVIYHLDCNNGVFKFKAKSIVIPHDIKAIAHRDLPGLRIPFVKYIMYKIMYAMDFCHADVIVGISDVDKGEIQEYYPKYQDKVVRVYDPIDIPVCERYIEERENNIVAINLQFHHKNIITLIKAFELIKDEIEENLVLVGNVPDRVMYLKDYVKEHSLEDRVRFTGFVSDDERNHLLQNCKLYVTPTLFEGFGMVAVEAITSGVPTLVSKIPTNYEVTQGLCSYYEPAEDPQALADAIKKQLVTKCNPEEMLVKAHKIEECYNYRNISAQYWDLFNS
ncbi:MAG: glycosyltransferase family 4 protein [Saccharofermentans sp.]|nr:glycosyltransferase family 4 protein [Saccharofermentans sp.]